MTLSPRLLVLRKQVDYLQSNLRETSAKLTDAQNVAASVKLNSELVLSNMVPEVFERVALLSCGVLGLCLS